MILRLLLSLIVCAARAAAPVPIPSLVVEKHVLPNGLVVLLREDHSSPIVAVNIWYKVGSKNEEPGRTGFAHLFEHYMFEGSANAKAGEYFSTIFGMGGTTNANTTNDRTDYFAVVPAESLEEILRLESDRMAYLTIDQAGLDKQRPIVKNEKRLRENKAYAGVWEKTNETVWDQGHPYRWPVIGSMQDLDAASLQDIKTFHDRYYLPNNAVIVVNGDHDSAKTLAMIEKWFGPIPAGPTPPALAMPPAGPMPARRDAVLDDPKAQLPMLVMAFRIPGAGKPGSREADVAATILAGGRTSRLVQKLQYEQRLVLQIGGGAVGQQEEDVVMLRAVPAPGVTTAQVEAAIRAEIDEFARSGPTDRELNRVKAGLRASALSAMQEAGGMASSLAAAEGRFGDPHAVEAEMAQITGMDAAAPQAAARRYLTPSNTAVIVVRPAVRPVPAPRTGGQP